MSNQYEKEIDMYPDIIKSLENYFDFIGYKYEIFNTWQTFNPKIKDKFTKEIEILGNIEKPDIMVFYETQEGTKGTLIIEVKKASATIKDIAQAKMYGDIFNAENVFLVAPTKLRREIVQYYNYNNLIMRYGNEKVIHYVQFDNKKLLIAQAFPSLGDSL